MPFLSPAKLLVIVVIGLVVLGPDKLPRVAKQIGGLWADFRRFRQQLESDVRNSFPDLPSTEALTHAVRSPLSFLDTLADTHGAEDGASTSGALDADRPDDPADGTDPPSGLGRSDYSEVIHPESATTPGAVFVVPGGIDERGASRRAVLPDDPGLN
jgi:Sec-independent protein translocase protein TatA